MNKTFPEAEDLITEIAEGLENFDPGGTEVVLCPPFLYLEMATDISKESKFKTGAQNIYESDSGAFTGEISAVMLRSLEVGYCIIGHSERRKYFDEDPVFLTRKVSAALRNHIRPIFCCGEVLTERDAGIHFKVVKDQLDESVFSLSAEEFMQVVIAYEPVWAIGTGFNATPAQAQEMHAYIRGLISERYDAQVASEISILYGGSCNAGNAKELFDNPDVDGGLIGGASLNSGEFLRIIQSV